MTTAADDRVRTEYCLVSLGVRADYLSAGEIADALGVPRPAGDHPVDPEPPGILPVSLGGRGATVADAMAGYRDLFDRLAGPELTGLDLRVEAILRLHAGRVHQSVFALRPADLRAFGLAGCALVVDAFPPRDEFCDAGSNSGLKYFSVTCREPGYRGRGGYLTSARDSSSHVVSHLIHGRLVSALRTEELADAIHIAYAADNGRGGFRIANPVLGSCAAAGVGLTISLFPPP